MTSDQNGDSSEDEALNWESSDEPRLRVLLAEYDQMWQSMRDDHHISGRREALLVTISFGILAYTLGQDLSLVDLLAAASASILIFLYFLFCRERIAIFADLRAERVRSLEAEMNKIVGNDSACFSKSS